MVAANASILRIHNKKTPALEMKRKVVSIIAHHSEAI
jgi:hypothetical protein